MAQLGVTPLANNLTNTSLPSLGITNVEAGATVTALFDGSPGTVSGSTVSPSTPLAAGIHTLTVFQVDPATNRSPMPDTQYTFTVDLLPPTGGAISHLPILGQVAGFTMAPDVSINVTGSVDNLLGPIAYALSTSNTAVPAAFPLGTGPTVFSGIVAPATTVFLWARDLAGNAAPVASTTITRDNTAPTVVANPLFLPQPGNNVTTAFGPFANIQIRFSERVQNPVQFIRTCINPCGVTAIPGTLTFDATTGLTAILDPFGTSGTGLFAATQYEIELLPHIRDPAGNPLTGVGAVTGPRNSPWIFTTSSDATPPGPVTGLTAAPGIQRMVLNWTPPADPDLARITVLRGTLPPAAAGDATAARFSLPAGARTFTDVGLTPLVRYHYAVYAEDAVGNPSALARTFEVARAPVTAGPGCAKPPNTVSARLMRPKKGKFLGTLRPLMRWKGKKSAVIYNIQIEDLNVKGKRKILSGFSRKPSYKVPRNRLKPGHCYAWRVWAYRGRTRGYVKIPMTSWFNTKVKAKP